MKDKEKSPNLFDRLRYHSWFLAFLWTGCIGGSLLWNFHDHGDQIVKVAHNTAEVTFENDVLYRRWAAQQGGVYVVASEQTPPNPYLHVPNRDVATTSGASLTLVNPAYMVRQVNEMAKESRASRGHITSLKPIRPANRADAWETAALVSFEKGEKEVASVENLEDGEYLRLMRPFVVEQPCLKCHAEQGYKEGDIRGGISVSVPLAPLRAIEARRMAGISLAHLGLWVIGLAGIAISKKGLAKQLLARETVEEALRESEQRHRLLAETMLQGVVHQDADGKIIAMNPAAERILGKTPEEFLGRTSVDEAHHTLREDGSPLPGLEHPAMVAMRSGQPLQDVVMGVLNPRENAYRWISISAVPSFRPGEDQPYQVFTVFEDITERKRADEALRRSAEELARSNGDLEQFAYVASHDLQEPLRMVTGFMQLLQKKYGDHLDAEADEFIEYAVEGAKRMQTLIGDLLAYARVGTRGCELVPTDAGATLHEALDNLRLTIEETGAQITYGKLPVVRADGTQLLQLFQNLIGNAMKFRSAEPPKVHVEAHRKGDHWLVSVRDNGIGFDPEFRDRIFLIFQRLHTRQEYSGTGIGLAICKKIVERHGGRIWVESRPGEGTVFYFTLPV
jgi:two-component system, chemotaxis family, sensor kinase Cph1